MLKFDIQFVLNIFHSNELCNLVAYIQGNCHFFLTEFLRRVYCTFNNIFRFSIYLRTEKNYFDFVGSAPFSGYLRFYEAMWDFKIQANWLKNFNSVQFWKLKIILYSNFQCTVSYLMTHRFTIENKSAVNILTFISVFHLKTKRNFLFNKKPINK